MTLENAINKYYRLIYSLVYGKTGKDKQFTEESCNDIFFLFWLKGENKIKDNLVYPWLLKTADNKIKEYFRRKKKDSVILSIEDLNIIPADKIDLSDRIIKENDILSAKEKLLSLLSVEERQLYEDYFQHKMSYVEIAQKLGIDRNTVTRRIHIITKKLTDEANKVFGITGAYIVLEVLADLFKG